ncbi:2TM domain-containing protein [Myxococcus stipitatus]|uniref:2TM domain-containing protein n=1 Tax=Myxococcus stipitatus TaxID=83455 RepID=UPI001F259733|nr:2TM domain-containing protein [Myxococcus stipitatus]MCE9669718.1 2TM domain-containing protein [Myxococcus stipitatus]
MADTRQKSAPARFSEREAADIIRDASTRSLAERETDRSLTREDLLAMAREMGVSESALKDALAARARKAKFRRQTHRALFGLATHGLSYTIVMGGLTLIDLTTGPEWFVQFPAISWGIGLAFHAMATLMGMAKRMTLPEDP